MVTITLNKIKAHEPCEDGWEKLLEYLGKTEPDDDEFPLAEVLKSHGLSGALWCLRCLPEHDSKWRLLAVQFARQVQPFMKDQRSINALAVAERYANVEATDSELEDAETAAMDAAEDAAGVAIDASAAWAAWAAAWAADWAASKDAAWAAAKAADCAASVPAWGACAAAREKQIELFLEAIA